MASFFNKIFKRNTGDAIITTPYESTGTSLNFSNLFTSNTSMNISAVYRAVEIISDSIAMLPIHVQLIEDNYCTTLSKQSHSLYSVFDNKNNLMSKYNFIKLLIQSVLLRGNGFAYVERNNDGSVKNLRFLESGDVNIHYDKQKNTIFYQAAILGKNRIEPINMIHLFKNSYNGVNGISTLSYAARSVKNSNYTEEAALNFYESGCNLAGILTVQGQLTPQQRKDIKSSWMQLGGNNGLAVLQGNMEYKPIQLSASDSQLLESRLFNVSDIARFFGISPVLLGDLSHSSYSTIEAAQKELVLHTLQPYIVMVEEEFNKKLLKPSESNLQIDLDETYLLTADKSTEMTYYTGLVTNGIMSRNEVRAKLGLNRVEGADELIIPYTDIQQNKINQKENERN